MPAEATARALAADWLGAFGRAADRLEEMLARHPSTAARELATGLGAGGDNTLVIDRSAEDLIFGELAALHEEGASFTAISEERGTVVFGDGESAVRVVIDPIDGSLNAKRMVPTHCVSIAVAGGETMEDVELAFVRDFGTGEEFVARRTRGATVDGRDLDPDAARSGLELVGFEAARPEWIAPVAARLEGTVYRIRVVGSVAMTLCYVAAGRFDGMVTANTCRSVDAAAAQLVAREAGAFVSVLGHGGLEAPLDLSARFRIVAARTPEDLETLVQAAIAAGLPEERRRASGAAQP